jgi:hypothetical protein
MSARETAVRAAIPLAIPKTIDGVDARWLTEALSVTDPGLVVESATVLKSLGGACTKLRVEVKANRPELPQTVIVKGCFEPHTHRMLRMQMLEANVYARVVPKLSGIQTVRTYFAQADEGQGAALILEDLDLRGARCLRALQPITDFELASRFVAALARLHSQWWNSSELGPKGMFTWVPSLSGPGPGRAEGVLSDAEQRADIYSRPRGAATPLALHDAEQLLRAFETQKSSVDTEPLVLAHGDPHLSNLFVDAQGGAGLLDWTCLRAPWAHDLTYFIAGCLDIVDRRRWEAALIAHYLVQLDLCGVRAPSFDEAWLAYRRWHLWGLMIWLTNSTDYHTESQITAMTARYATAVLDHDSLPMLGSRR